MTLRTFYHYSAKTVPAVKSTPPNPINLFKPEGFWISDDNDFGWLEWCKEEEFRLDGLNIRHEVIVDTTDILWIKTAKELIDLDARYNSPGFPRKYEFPWHWLHAEYKGIIISPYQWSLRLDGPAWYYPWDCASGCIWDASAVRSITPIHEIATAQ